MGRAALDLSIDQLAAKAGVSHAEVQRVETGASAEPRVLDLIRTALESAGIEWVGQDGVRYTGQNGDGTIPVEQLNSYNDE